MVRTRLTPTIECLTDETVLIQAWKKTSTYIRYHNWFADTLELDRISINLPDFIATLSIEIRKHTDLLTDTIRIVPAPKSQRWGIDAVGKWAPSEESGTASKIRPLAHISLRDQVICTAIMLCLADRVEDLQGDPNISIDMATTQSVLSYGNRLFSDFVEGKALHRWGSTTLYRGFYQDYQKFLSRPEHAAERIAPTERKVFIVQSDLRQFYDRVSRDLLVKNIRSLKQLEDDDEFFDFAANFLRWKWSGLDLKEVKTYAKQARLPDFDEIVLPQGLVSAGFFANIALLPFDDAVRSEIQKDIALNLTLHDAARYVDDLRFVFSGPQSLSLQEVEESASLWLSDILSRTAPSLTIAREKTIASAFRSDERPFVQQSRRMARIQSAISGGFDPIGGGEILDSVLALVRTQERLAKSNNVEPNNPFSPIPDVRDATVDRFAAGRYRKTYRALRPLLWETEDAQKNAGEDDESSQFKGVRNRKELDEETRAFSLDLISKWIEDPSNVRLLRIALDLWPASDVLDKILNLLRPFTEKGGRRKAPRRIAWYCLSEILRAGATETGFVSDREQLPFAVDLEAYRGTLRNEAIRILSVEGTTLPWYLKQQAYLYLMTNPPLELKKIKRGKPSHSQKYKEMIRFLLGEFKGLTTVDFATYAVLARRSYLTKSKAVQLTLQGVTPARINRIASLDPNFADELIEANPEILGDLTPRNMADLGRGEVPANESHTLATLVLKPETRNLMRNEISILSFCYMFLSSLQESKNQFVISPSEVTISLSDNGKIFKEVSSVGLHSRNLSGKSPYEPPNWVQSSDWWRFQLGFLIRFILTASPDFTRPVRISNWREYEAVYRAPESHWHQRIYGFYNGHAAFGEDWLSISDWLEDLLFALLWWPGCPRSDRWIDLSPNQVLTQIGKRLEGLKALQGTSTALLPLRLSRGFVRGAERPIRGCVVQTVLPKDSDFEADLEMSSPTNRTRHRRHLSAALAAVERALALRETHMGRDGRLDWLILPELAVHPADVQTHLVPFARAHRSIVLAGLTYQRLYAGQPLVNSALWILPTQDAQRGLQVLLRRQGKWNLAPAEQKINENGNFIQPFRPCQWLIGYQWSNDELKEPLWLSAAICFDATDIRLAADLKDRSDIFVVPALNKDVTTFDQMALALHYHMFQMVVVANNGNYGGSNAYAPYKDPWQRQIFHAHGQPQAAISFFELDHIEEFQNRKFGKPEKYKFKAKPAGEN